VVWTSSTGSRVFGPGLSIVRSPVLEDDRDVRRRRQRETRGADLRENWRKQMAEQLKASWFQVMQIECCQSRACA
jgi:hypothetical protein